MISIIWKLGSVAEYSPRVASRASRYSVSPSPSTSGTSSSTYAKNVINILNTITGTHRGQQEAVQVVDGLQDRRPDGHVDGPALEDVPQDDGRAAPHVHAPRLLGEVLHQHLDHHVVEVLPEALGHHVEHVPGKLGVLAPHVALATKRKSVKQ